MGGDKQGGGGIAVLAAVIIGTGAAPGGALVSGLIVESFIPGAVSFEMGFLVALFLAGLCGFVAGWPSALLGVFCRLFPGRLTGWFVSLVGILMGALVGEGTYFWIIAPAAQVPELNVRWVGVVSTVGSTTAGGVAGLTSWLIVRSIDKRRRAMAAD